MGALFISGEHTRQKKTIHTDGLFNRINSLLCAWHFTFHAFDVKVDAA